MMNNKQGAVLQDVFLNQVRKERVQVTMYLINGFQMRGQVKGFDSFTVVIDCDGKQTLVYKHAISSISPARPVNFSTEETNGEA